jgi:hypothetical protein
MSDVTFSPSPISKESPQWVADKEAKACASCQEAFSLTNRKHHCRNCGQVFCTACCSAHVQLPQWPAAERLCQPCHLAYARGGRQAPSEVAGGSEGLNVENNTGTAEFHDILVDSQKDGVTARGAANLTLIRCHIKAAAVGVQKSGTGYVTLTDCDVTASEGITVGGSVKLTVSGGVIVGDEVCIRARGSGTLTLENCHIVSRKGTAIECSGGVKAELINCTVVGKVAISGSGSCEFTVRGGSIASQNSLHPMLLKAPIPLAGKDSNTIVFKGPCKLVASEGAKITGNHNLHGGATVVMQ